jgi:hypothetical protein
MKILSLFTESTLSWKLHTEQILRRLSAVSYALTSIESYMSQEAMKMVYYACLHSAVSNAIVDSTKNLQNTKKGN